MEVCCCIEDVLLSAGIFYYCLFLGGGGVRKEEKCFTSIMNFRSVVRVVGNSFWEGIPHVCCDLMLVQATVLSYFLPV